MADRRHFENSIISIPQPRIIRFRLNLVHRYKFRFRACEFDEKSKFFKFKMAYGRHIENRFWLNIGAILADKREIWNSNEASHADIDHVTKTAIFSDSRWRTSGILKAALSQCRTVVPRCCKGDAASQWEMAILGVSELRNP